MLRSNDKFLECGKFPYIGPYKIDKFCDWFRGVLRERGGVAFWFENVRLNKKHVISDVFLI